MRVKITIVQSRWFRRSSGSGAASSEDRSAVPRESRIQVRLCVTIHTALFLRALTYKSSQP